MTFTVIIPARYGSTRLEGKPLLDIGGKTMIERVYQSALRSSATRVIVATDDQRIEKIVTDFGGDVCMTKADHTSGTDRLQEVATQLQLNDSETIVNVQGDEPLIPPQVIDQVAELLKMYPDASVSTLSESINSPKAYFDHNVVKVVCDRRGYALYFSRSPVPCDRDNASTGKNSVPDNYTPQRHIGIYGYRVQLLHNFVHWKKSSLEETEKLEQLRILFNGERIIVKKACVEVPPGVDTFEDLRRLRSMFDKGNLA